MLPQFGFAEFFLLAAVALIVVGPKDLPVMMRKLGQFMARGRAMANEFKDAFDDIARDAELDELRKEIESLKHDNAVTQAIDDMKAVEKEINDSVMRDTGSAPVESTASPDTDPPKDAPKVDPA